jgi:hypothetical protein
MTGTPALQPGRRPGHGRGDPGALTRELQLEGASPPEGQDDVGPFAERIQNLVDAPASQSTSVPRAWADKQRALMFTFQALSKDTDGSFRERLKPPDGSDWQLDTLSLKAPPGPPGPEMPLRALRGGT